MKRLFAILFLLVSCAFAQTTPNMGFNIPNTGKLNWGPLINANFGALDNFLSGQSFIPQLKIQNYVDFNAQASAPVNPASGFCRVYFDLNSGNWLGINSTGSPCVANGGGIANPTFTGTVTFPDGSTWTVSSANTGKITFPTNNALFISNPAGDVQEYWLGRGYPSFNGIGWQVLAQNGSLSGGGMQIYENSQSCNGVTMNNGMIVMNDYLGTNIFCAGRNSTSGGLVVLPGGMIWSNGGGSQPYGFNGDFFQSNGAGLQGIQNSGSATTATTFFIANDSTTLKQTGMSAITLSTKTNDCFGTATNSFAIARFGENVNTGSISHPEVCVDDNGEYVYKGGIILPISGVVASGTAAMTTAAIAAGACGTTVTVSATNVATTDVIDFSYNAAASANPGVLVINRWPTLNNVNFEYCNPTAGSITPTAATLNWRVAR